MSSLEGKLQILQYKHKAINISCGFFCAVLFTVFKDGNTELSDRSFLLRILLLFPGSNTQNWHFQRDWGSESP